MKITAEIDCTPTEAREALGLPDVQKVNEIYVAEMAKFIQNAGSMEQLQNFGKMMAPMGEAGMKMFSTFLGGAMNAAAGSSDRKGAKKAE